MNSVCCRENGMHKGLKSVINSDDTLRAVRLVMSGENGKVLVSVACGLIDSSSVLRHAQ